MAREQIIAGNWKMYKKLGEASDFVKSLAPEVEGTSATVLLAVPFTAIASCAEIAQGGSIMVGAQNMHDCTDGAFTGEIAGEMLKDAGASFVLLGHSERRQIFGETDAFINAKVKHALELDLRPVLCIGETLEEREAGRMEEVLEGQIKNSLEGLKAKDLKDLVLAYEPVWAIGTGVSATAEMAQEAHVHCRGVLEKLFGKRLAGKLPILYGGSVKAENGAELMGQGDIDGVLVGSASLCPDSFAQIVNQQKVLS